MRFNGSALIFGLLVHQTLISDAFVIRPKISTSMSGNTRPLTLSIHASPRLDDETSSKSATPFVNSGPFSWMEPFLDIIGFKEGMQLNYAAPRSVDLSNVPSNEEAASLRREAADNVMNIGMDERERRRQGGNISFAVVAAYAAYAAIVLDDGGFGGHLARFAVVLVSEPDWI